MNYTYLIILPFLLIGCCTPVEYVDASLPNNHPPCVSAMNKELHPELPICVCRCGEVKNETIQPN